MKTYKNRLCLDCNQPYKPAGPCQKRCAACQVGHRRTVLKSWRYVNRVKQRARVLAWARKHPERRSVASHRYMILNPRSKYHKQYKGMPFYDGWNPDKGGSIKNGEIWIIKNLGKKPKGSSLHIMDHSLGFVPGNLEWATPKKQTSEQMFRIIARLRHRIKELENERKMA